MIRALLAGAVALALVALAYGGMGVVAAVLAGWSTSQLGDQLLGLGIHASVVFVRGLLPAVVLSLVVSSLAARLGLGSERWRLVVSPLASAALVVPLLLTSDLGTWPRLMLEDPGSGLATVALLAAGSLASVLAADLVLSRRVRAPS